LLYVARLHASYPYRSTLLNYCVCYPNSTSLLILYPLSLHDALPISAGPIVPSGLPAMSTKSARLCALLPPATRVTRVAVNLSFRSEEHTSELQSRVDIV